MSSSSSRYTFSSTQRNNMSKEEKRRKDLERRAKNNHEVHLQMVEEYEREDGDNGLRSIFKKHLEAKYPKQWPKLNDEQKEDVINHTMMQNRIPWTPKGGKRKTRRHKSKKIVRKTNKRKTNKRKTNKRKTNKRKTHKKK